MGHMLSTLAQDGGSAPFAVAALLLFFLIFVGVVVWTYRSGRKEEIERQGLLPFDSDELAGMKGTGGEKQS